ncbi:hypothetical protein [Methylobacterium crusticola]|nr:hypothetical protein [Methylobacterium crusticola]
MRTDDLDRERDRIAELREALCRFFAEQGPNEAHAFDVLLARGEL